MWKQKVQETVDFLSAQLPEKIDFAVVLGSGLSGFYEALDVQKRFAYSDLPNFPKSTVAGHTGELIWGKWKAINVLVMVGRFHYYEGYSMQEVTFPIRIFGELGIQKIILSNASGGVNPTYKVGDLILVKDHINFFPEHPLRGVNNENWGPRFVDMSKPYDEEMLQSAEEVGLEKGIALQRGNYMGLQGPTFETPAEYGMVRLMGCDVVGMSTVPEVIVARHMDMRVFCISVVTDLGGPELSEPVSHEEVLAAAEKAKPKMRDIVTGIFEKLK